MELQSYKIEGKELNELKKNNHELKKVTILKNITLRK